MQLLIDFDFFYKFNSKSMRLSLKFQLFVCRQETSKGKIESARLNLNDKELSQAVSDATQVLTRFF